MRGRYVTAPDSEAAASVSSGGAWAHAATRQSARQAPSQRLPIRERENDGSCIAEDELDAGLPASSLALHRLRQQIDSIYGTPPSPCLFFRAILNPRSGRWS